MRLKKKAKIQKLNQLIKTLNILTCKQKKSIKRVQTQGLQQQKKKKIMVLSNCAVCGGKKLRFIKGQESGGILSRLGITTDQDKIPLVDLILF